MRAAMWSGCEPMGSEIVYEIIPKRIIEVAKNIFAGAEIPTGRGGKRRQGSVSRIGCIGLRRPDETVSACS
jgi:hypothetical protein